MESRKTFWDVKQEVGGKYSTSERLDVRKVVIESSIKSVWANVEMLQQRQRVTFFLPF